jgi:hypothetical protein
MKKKMVVLAVVLLAGISWRLIPAQAQSLVGVWRSQTITAMGPAFSEVILMPNGTFTKTFRYGSFFTRDVGRYTVGQGYVHFTIEDHEPKYYLGRPMHWLKSETWLFTFEGPDRVVFEDRLTNSRWTAYRSTY